MLIGLMDSCDCGTVFGVRPKSKRHVGGWCYGLVGSSHSECMGAVARQYDPKPYTLNPEPEVY